MQEKLDILDSLEVLSFDNHMTEYPVHYHETYCISLIHAGVFGENELIAPQGSIVISHPFEIHKNKLIENIGVSFTTFYVSENFVNTISPFENTTFDKKIIDDPFIFNQLNLLNNYATSNKQQKNFTTNFSTTFSQTVSYLACTYGHDEPFLMESLPSLLDEVQIYIDNNLNSKINLEGLAKIVGMSKFQFTRWFKNHVGITPFEYILLKRVGFGKRLIQKGVPLVDVSLDSGFYDQSHFSNYFKKYVGMSPKAYKHSCNIFQDL